ncbi:helix-turn-helix transcriptional regulator [Mammaliicoccus sciuri]|uniref:helix-turn-helix transcriptional regulator n=1 Tax=Mammaliicoccus sciuri TaxID=1296 RepID=UPI00066E081E|nr:helix-turn-helix domain-containing protein [Mammaliicoccus sciuri]MBU6089448.1 helix-turn-helix domain-containing protein [Mammaliicoccus sciuri]MBW3109314.1 helix-turn-helix domain-containing protein [Mammaliicoccus sciuri]MEB6122779.1 helix-turn-helix domain-containing protein [Mammaliicoccus sciuri]MEB6313008.1 helix-turn-helix domain-containing protein [Mammaliicoccus sciuri]MEB6696514.1 helix-turn-helix domain-containing protein [Mammaliicoccus sciuri]
MITKKKELKQNFLLPKNKLKEARIKKGYSATYMASLIGVDRRQYVQKENGLYSFHDYEMVVLCRKLNLNFNIFFI